MFLAAQEGDWFPVPSDQVSYFNQGVHTMKIDSIVENDTTQVYYNIRTPEYIGGDEDYAYLDPYSSWMGKYIIANEDFINFKTSTNLQFKIVHKSQTAEPWRFAEHENTYIEAFVGGLDEIEIVEGLTDSVKYIYLQKFDEGGNLIVEFEDTIVLSKNYGFVKVFPFIAYPNNQLPIRGLIGLEYENNKYGYEYKLTEHFSSYQTGYQLHFETLSKSIYPFKSRIIDKHIGEYYIDYDMEYCYENGDLVNQTKRFYPTLYPGQSILFDSNEDPKGFYRVFGTSSNWNGYDEVLLQFYNYYFYGEYNGVFVWMDEIGDGSNCISPPIYRVNNLFWAEYESCPDYDFIIQYVYTGDFEYGEPYTFECEVGNEELHNSKLSISPNPSNGIFKISSSQKIEELKVYNINGQIVWQVKELKETQIDLSNLSDGLYLLETKTENQELIHQKVVIKK